MIHITISSIFQTNENKIKDIQPHLGKVYHLIEFVCTSKSFKIGAFPTVIEVSTDAGDTIDEPFLKNLMKNTFDKEKIDFKIIN